MTDLATIAAAERDRRLRDYPALVVAGRVALHVAEDDCEAWLAFADACARRVSLRSALEERGWRLNWSQCGEALDRALASRRRAAEANPDDADARTRLAGVVAIDAVLRPQIDAVLAFNAAIRAGLAQRQAAAA